MDGVFGKGILESTLMQLYTPMKTNITLTVDIGQKAPCSIEHTLTYIFIHGGYSSVMFVFGVVSRNYTYPLQGGAKKEFLIGLKSSP